MTRTTWAYCLMRLSSASISWGASANFLAYRVKAFFFEVYQCL